MPRQIDFIIGLVLAVPIIIVFISDVISYRKEVRRKKEEAKRKKEQPKVMHGYIINGKGKDDENQRGKKL